MFTLNIIIFIIITGGLISGKLFSFFKLPSILGMLIFGIIFGYFFKSSVPESLWIISPTLISMALIIILLRAGLTINKNTLKKIGTVAFLMSFIPCILEGISLIFVFKYLFGFSFEVAGMTGFILAAVSPAVVVPSMLYLKEKEKTGKNDAPTIVLAGASLDDVFAITIFYMFLELSTTETTVNYSQTLLSLPVSIIAGIIAGIVLGYLLVIYFKRNKDKIRATEKTLIILMLALLLRQIGDWLHIAALLGIMTTGFIILEKTDFIARELSLKLSKLWIPAEIVLFVLIGLAVDVNVALSAGLKGLLAISIGLFFRTIGVFIATSFSKLTIKERIFCAISYLPKATVQAAIGGMPLAMGVGEGKIILAIAVLSILFTAPLGLFGIKLFGERLLTESNY